MAKAIAITARNPLGAAVHSARNFSHLVVDYMYGTPERTHVTMVFALAMAVLGVVLNAVHTEAIMNACSTDLLLR